MLRRNNSCSVEVLLCLKHTLQKETGGYVSLSRPVLLNDSTLSLAKPIRFQGIAYITDYRDCDTVIWSAPSLTAYTDCDECGYWCLLRRTI
jgi:hypothetical protein